MGIAFVCPSCKGAVRSPDEHAGKQGKCPNCGDRIRVPLPDLPSDADEVKPKAKTDDFELTQIVSGAVMANRVVVVDFDMPIGSMVILMLKWAVASIPAAFIIGIVLGIAYSILLALRDLITIS